MAGRNRYIMNRHGRWYARLAVPKDLVPYVGKTDLRTPLGADYREALKKLPGAVALLQHEIALGERRAVEAGAKPTSIARYPLAPEQIALRNYQARLAFDDELRNSDPRYASSGSVDELLAARLREGIAGRLSDDELKEVVGIRVERFRRLGNTDAQFGTDEWRILARAMCVSDYEAMSRVAERDEGDFSGQIEHPMLKDVPPVTVPASGVIRRICVSPSLRKSCLRSCISSPIRAPVKAHRMGAQRFAAVVWGSSLVAMLSDATGR